jgi:hypothetical protein
MDGSILLVYGEEEESEASLLRGFVPVRRGVTALATTGAPRLHETEIMIIFR